MGRLLFRLIAVTTVLTAIAGVLAGASFASGEPFMPCCFNVGGGAHNMACCAFNLAMECCKKFF